MVMAWLLSEDRKYGEIKFDTDLITYVIFVFLLASTKIS